MHQPSPFHLIIIKPKLLTVTAILVIGIALISATSHALMGPGLTTATPFTAYLNGTFPGQLTDSWQWTAAYTGTGLNQIITARKVPGTDLMAFGSIDGRIYTFDFHATNPTAVLIGDIAPATTYLNNRYGLKGIAFHPEYGQAGSPNREYIYVAYMGANTTRRLSRFRIPANTGLLDVNSELIMIDQLVP